MKTTKTLLFASLLLVTLLTVGCKNRNAIEMPRWQEDGIGTVDDYIKISANRLELPATGEKAYVKIASSGSWTMSGESDWCTVSNTEGENKATIRFSADANTASDRREALFTLTCGKAKQTIRLGQEPQNILLIDNTHFEISDKEQTVKFNVITNGNLSFNVIREGGEGDWIKLNDIIQSEPMKYQVSVTLTRNTATKSRTCILKFNKGYLIKEVKIVQASGRTPDQ